ncbi:hypothetical protein ACR6C2_01560 [Streptomyces sp. INA 01156]
MISAPGNAAVSDAAARRRPATRIGIWRLLAGGMSAKLLPPH